MNMKNFDYVGKSKLTAIIVTAIMLVGLAVNLIFGVELDINFKGGTLIKYAYSGEVDLEAFEKFASDTTKVDLDATFSKSGDDTVIELSTTKELDLDTMDKLETAAKKEYKDNKLELLSSNSLNATMSRKFFIKCLVAVLLAIVFLLVYIALRFKNIGGLSAGAMAVTALINDLLIAYFSFVIFRIPLNDNFVAVLLTILGYSLNATLVIFDRIRENRRLMVDSSIKDVVNTSIGQSFSRTFNTSLCTFAAIAVVAIVAWVMNVDSIISFAVPMMIGIVSGFFSSVFIAGPWWVGLFNKIEARRAARPKKAGKAKAKAKNKKRKTTRL